MNHPEILGYTYLGTTTKRKVTKAEIPKTREGLVKFLKGYLTQEEFNKITDTDIDGYMNDMKRAGIENAAVEEYVKPILTIIKNENSRNATKKINELYNLGRFVYSMGKTNSVKLVEAKEPPDFIVEHNNELVGIEITGIFNEDVVAEINIAKELLRKCQEKLVAESNIKATFHLNIIPEKLKFSKTKESVVINSICGYINSIANLKPIEPPPFLRLINVFNSDTVDLILYEQYWLKHLAKESVTKTIQGKEKDIPKYKASNGLQKCWLLITIGGASENSSFDYTQIEGFDLETKFDNIFIHDVFSGKIIYSKFQL